MLNAWITEPPVEVITDPADLQDICTRFSNEVETSPEPPRLPRWRLLLTPLNFERVLANEAREHWEWEQRKSQANYDAMRFEMFAADAEVRDRKRFCVYKPGKVVGLMIWRHDFDRNHGSVDNLAMLPEHESEGTILIEYAVNLSEEAGYEGRTYFGPFDREPYRPSWLQCLKSAMVVPRDESDEWVHLDGVWRLKKNFPRGLRTKSARNIASPK